MIPGYWEFQYPIEWMLRDPFLFVFSIVVFLMSISVFVFIAIVLVWCGIQSLREAKKYNAVVETYSESCEVYDTRHQILPMKEEAKESEGEEEEACCEEVPPAPDFLQSVLPPIVEERRPSLSLEMLPMPTKKRLELPNLSGYRQARRRNKIIQTSALKLASLHAKTVSGIGSQRGREFTAPNPLPAIPGIVADTKSREIGDDASTSETPSDRRRRSSADVSVFAKPPEYLGTLAVPKTGYTIESDSSSVGTGSRRSSVFDVAGLGTPPDTSQLGPRNRRDSTAIEDALGVEIRPPSLPSPIAGQPRLATTSLLGVRRFTAVRRLPALGDVIRPTFEQERSDSEDSSSDSSSSG